MLGLLLEEPHFRSAPSSDVIIIYCEIAKSVLQVSTDLAMGQV